MAVLTRTTDIKVGDTKRFIELMEAKPNPSKVALEQVEKAKRSSLFQKDK